MGARAPLSQPVPLGAKAGAKHDNANRPASVSAAADKKPKTKRHNHCPIRESPAGNDNLCPTLLRSLPGGQRAMTSTIFFHKDHFSLDTFLDPFFSILRLAGRIARFPKSATQSTP